MFEANRLDKFLHESKLFGWKIICTSLTEDSVTLDTLPIEKNDNVMLVLGSEGSGITQLIAETATYNLKVEGFTNSTVDSLNVGVTAGILLHSLKHKLN